MSLSLARLRRRGPLYLGVALLALLAVAAVAGAKGGTAKPPKGNVPVSPVPVPVSVNVPVPNKTARSIVSLTEKVAAVTF